MLGCELPLEQNDESISNVSRTPGNGTRPNGGSSYGNEFLLLLLGGSGGGAWVEVMITWEAECF